MLTLLKPCIGQMREEGIFFSTCGLMPPYSWIFLPEFSQARLPAPITAGVLVARPSGQQTYIIQPIRGF